MAANITSPEYQKAKKIVERYENQRRKMKEERAMKNVHSKSNLRRFEKAKKLYPVGTKFTSLWGATDVVTERPFLGYKDAFYSLETGGDIFVTRKHEERMIYSKGAWAAIHKK